LHKRQRFLQEIVVTVNAATIVKIAATVTIVITAKSLSNAREQEHINAPVFIFKDLRYLAHGGRTAKRP